MQDILTLHELGLGESAYVSGLSASGAMQARLLDLGFTSGSKVTCLFTSALGDPRAYQVKGTVIALRAEDAQTVLCQERGCEP